MLALYRTLIVLMAPLALLWLRWKLPGPNALRKHWPERLGLLKPGSGPSIWLHAASVGELNAVTALIDALLQDYPEHELVLSTMTLTGRAEAMKRFGERVRIVHVPLDTPLAVRRWLKRIQPALGLIAETEIWPELFLACQRRQLPLVMVNARMTKKAARGYRRFSRLFSRTLGACELVICQTAEDAQRFAAFGVDEARLSVAGNMKFDRDLPADLGRAARSLREQWGQRPVWVAGSTRPGEEEILLEAQLRLLGAHPSALLVLVPRHPERSLEVESLIQSQGLTMQRYGASVEAKSQVVLVDRIGVLLACYAAAPAAFVGGSLVDIGGHNLLEPAALGKVVIAGPWLHQQTEAAQALLAGNALTEAEDAVALEKAVRSVWEDPEAALERGRSARAVVEAGRGSLARTRQLIAPFLS